MFVFGHVYTTAESRFFRKVDLTAGEGVLALMLPDMLSSHDWGYENCWDVQSDKLAAALIQAHMIGDAVVHYGSQWETPRYRKGWAYQHMKIVSYEYQAFFDEARSSGYLLEEPKDSVRGWAHTMVEYAIDQHLTDSRNLLEPFQAIQRTYKEITGDLEWVGRTVADFEIVPAKPYPQQPFRYSGVIIRSEEPDEFHLRGLAAKFGLAEVPEVLQWIRLKLRRIINEIGRDELEGILKELCTIVNDPTPYGYPIQNPIWSLIHD